MALTIVNPLFNQDLPGYTIGRICIWEYMAAVIAAGIALLMIRSWGNIQIQEIEGRKVLTLNPKFGIYFGTYFIVAIVVAIWQFWLFSQQF